MQGSQSSHLDLKINLTTTSRATESYFGDVRCYNLLILYAVNKTRKRNNTFLLHDIFWLKIGAIGQVNNASNLSPDILVSAYNMDR